MYILSMFSCLTLVFLALIFTKPSKVERASSSNSLYTFDGITEYVKKELRNMCHPGYNPRKYHSNPLIMQRLNERRGFLLYALRQCTFGIKKDKEYIKDIILGIISNQPLDIDKIVSLIPYDYPHKLSAADKFDILLYLYAKDFNVKAFEKLVDNHHFLVADALERTGVAIKIDEEDIHKAYADESIYLTQQDRLNVIVQRIYQRFKGFSVIDTLREMDIDGVSGGVSGLTGGDLDDYNLHSIKDHLVNQPRNYDSVWVFYKGKSVHLSFMSFGSESELKRVCQNIYRFNNNGVLSQDIGYKINDMADGSRIVVVRPDFAESWAFFIRKFNTSLATLPSIVKGENSLVAIDLIKFLVKGGRIMSITGSQGSGKTTLMMALIGEIYHNLTLRVQETAFELHLRKCYPFRNILSFKETPTVNGQKGLDLQKKTDGSVSILGEVATDEVAAWMIQMAQVASQFTLFTHHAKTVDDLIHSIRNSLLKCDVFRDESIAEEQVVKVLQFDIHLVRESSGKRYIERITEILPEGEYGHLEYPLRTNYHEGDALNSAHLMRELLDLLHVYFRKSTKQLNYSSRDILRFDGQKYIVLHPISERQIHNMVEQMSNEDVVDFEKFVQTHWIQTFKANFMNEQHQVGPHEYCRV